MIQTKNHRQGSNTNHNWQYAMNHWDFKTYKKRLNEILPLMQVYNVFFEISRQAAPGTAVRIPRDDQGRTILR